MRRIRKVWFQVVAPDNQSMHVVGGISTSTAVLLGVGVSSRETLELVPPRRFKLERTGSEVFDLPEATNTDDWTLLIFGKVDPRDPYIPLGCIQIPRDACILDLELLDEDGRVIVRSKKKAPSEGDAKPYGHRDLPIPCLTWRESAPGKD